MALNPTVVNAENGQLPSSVGDLFTVTADTAYLAVDIMLYNTGLTDEDAILSIQPSGGTSYEVARFILDANGGYALVSSLKLGTGDKLRGVTDTAATVNWTVVRAEEDQT